MCSPHVSFLSNVIPKNVIWSLNSISLPNKMSFCNDPMFIFLLENIMALVFKVEILKPQSWDHISISSRADWILLSASLGDECLVQIALSFANWESDRFGTSPRASSKVFIMTLNKMGLRTLPWGQPFSRSLMSDVIHVNLCVMSHTSLLVDLCASFEINDSQHSFWEVLSVSLALILS